MYVPDGKPTCIRDLSGLDSVYWNARSRVLLDELVPDCFVGEMNLKDDGAVLSRLK